MIVFSENFVKEKLLFCAATGLVSVAYEEIDFRHNIYYNQKKMQKISPASKKKDYTFIFLCALLFVVIYSTIIVPLKVFDRVRLKGPDMLCMARNMLYHTSSLYSDVVIIMIDDKTLTRIDERWPWNRAFYAKIINDLSRAHPRFIALDLTFLGEQKENTQDDLALQKAIAAQDNVILASYFSREASHVRPKKIFTDAAFGVGFVNKLQDVDLSIRQARLVVFKDIAHKVPSDYSFEIYCLLKFLGARKNDVTFDAQGILVQGRGRIPVDAYGLLPINYLVPPEKLRFISLIDFLDHQEVYAKELRGKMIFMGQTSKISHEIFPTPIGFLPGVAINAYTFLTLAEKKYIFDFPFLLDVFLLFAVGFLAGLLGLSLRPARSIVMFCAFIAGMTGVAFYIFMQGYATDIIGYWIVGVALYTTANVYRYGQILSLRATLKRLVTMDVATEFFNKRYFLYRLDYELKKSKIMRTSVHVCIFEFSYAPAREDFKKEGPEYEKRIQFYKEAGGDIVARFEPFPVLIGAYSEDRLSVCVKNLSRARARDIAVKTREALSRNCDGFKVSVQCAMASYPHVAFTTGFSMVESVKAALARVRATEARFVEYDPSVDKVRATYVQRDLQDTQDLLEIEEDIKHRNKELLNVITQMKHGEEELRNAYFTTIVSLVNALEEKDSYTAGHSQRVSAYAVKLAAKMNLPRKEIETIREAALLHDIGKIGLPDALLHKKGFLTDEERAIIHKHQALGSHILEPITHFKEHLPLILYHHEWYNGKGYPHGLSGEMIPRGAQIVAIADTFDAMTTGRGYNKVMSPQEAIQELKRCSGTQFNPSYVESFIEVLKDEKLY
jgi:HD-GYP domain-containing protein (c-di-GMP phosphodiesterase class II)/CHASE2 domain-containing sensor protein